MFGALHVSLISLTGSHGTDVSIGDSVSELRNLITGEKLHWSLVGLLTLRLPYLLVVFVLNAAVKGK